MCPPGGRGLCDGKKEGSEEIGSHGFSDFVFQTRQRFSKAVLRRMAVKIVNDRVIESLKKLRVEN